MITFVKQLAWKRFKDVNCWCMQNT